MLTASVGLPSTEYPIEPSPSVRSRTRSGRISVFWWPTALWFVSGATTVVSPIGSRACFNARSPRDSTPSSFVIRIFGRVDQSWSGRADARSARGPPLVAPPATGSPRSLSTSRRSVRARSRVMSGVWPGPSSARTPSESSRLPRRAPTRFDHAGLRSSSLTSDRRLGGAGHAVHVRIHARDGLVWDADRTALAFLQPSRGTSGDRRRLPIQDQEVEEERGEDGRDRDPEDRTGHARDLAADQHGAQNDDRVNSDRLLHQARLED